MQQDSLNNYGYQSPVAIVPIDETLRVKRLHAYEIMDTPEEQVFDAVALMAAQVFDTPSAFISFVNTDKIFYKSGGAAIAGIDLELHKFLSALIILNRNPLLVINDTSTVQGLNTIKAVGQGNIKFYAGAVLITAEGCRIGSISVTDALERVPAQKQLDMLTTLATIIMNELELRLLNRKAVRVQTDLMNIALHELKNPLLNISLAAEMLEDQSEDLSLPALSKIILKNTRRLDEKLNDLLNLSQIENIEFRLNKELLDITALVKTVTANFGYMAAQKKQRIEMGSSQSFFIMADKKRVQEIMDNLLNNAIKFSYPETLIHITLRQVTNHIHIEFKDEGQGLTATDKEKLFTKFAKLSALPTGKERSSGLGLSIVKILAELHHGKVWANSEGKGKGASFFVSLPVGGEHPVC